METPPIIIHGPEQSQLNPNLPDGGLPPAIGVESYQVFRASKAVPEITDQLGWTYHHHVDIACWRGLLYVAWNSCEKDEDVWPSRELFSTSTNGKSWSPPQELFPQGVSTPLRMYFYHASNGRMLAIAGLRTDTQDTDEDRKGSLVVREIHNDHTLGEVYVLQGAPRVAVGSKTQPSFKQSCDQDFQKACNELLADTVFLEQQDRGKLLGPRAMQWHNPAAWPQHAVPGDSEKWVAGKAYSFFKRPDGRNGTTIVGISKMGWTTLSHDDGKTWSQPVVPPTLITGKAKVWSQQASDGRYALVYNPSTSHRYPLAIVTSDDGLNFHEMRIVQGELPVQRYEGMHRSVGPQYVRGLSRWSDDGSRAADHAVWLVYSMSKEDIWVSRVPLPVRGNETESAGSMWNVYSPKWSPVTIGDDEVRLEDGDPYDAAVVTRVVAPHTNARVTFDLLAEPSVGWGSSPPPVTRTGGDEPHPTTLQLQTHNQAAHPATVHELHCPRPNEWQSFTLHIPELTRLTFRRPATPSTHPVPPNTDRPQKSVAFRIRNLRVAPSNQ